MDTATWQRVRSIFERAVEIDAPARAAFLDAECGGDASVRAEVDELLRSDDASDGFTHFLDSGVVGELIGGRLSASLGGTTIGAYRIERVIASGGMGTVYEATQESPRRIVALKTMRAGLASPSAVRRFRWECETLARLRHPGIAQIHEAGTFRVPGRDEPLPFFAMEWVEGARTIVEWSTAEPRSTREILEMFLLVCDAVHHAHQKGVIHRDLKPANILVDAAGRPKIIDFGIARAVEADAPALTQDTQAGQIVGTVQYMSPEQADGARDEVDTRSDVYSLGVILHQLLARRLPFEFAGRTISECIRVVREDAPARLGSVVPALRGDLEWIVLKALEKDRTRRYESAAALAEDVRRHLRDEPVIAGPPSAGYRIAKFVRRHRLAVGAATIVAIALVAGITSTSLALHRARIAEAEARDQQTKAERSAKRAVGALDFVTELFRAADPEKGGRDVRVADRLAAGAAEARTRFADDPASEASVLESIGNTFVGIGLFAEGEAALRRAIERWDAAGDEGRDARIVTELNLATALQYQERYAEAEEIDRRALDESRRVLGPENETTLTLASNLGVVLKRLDRTDEAERLYRETLEVSRRWLGASHGLTTTLEGNLAQLLNETGRRAEGEPLLRSVIASGRDERTMDFSVVTAMNNLSALLRTDGRNDEAERVQRDVVAYLEARAGEDHPTTLSARVGLAESVQRQGRNDEAEAICRDVLERNGRTKALKRPDVANAHQTRFRALRALGRLPEAEAEARAVWSDHETMTPSDRISHGNDLALVLAEQGRMEEAEPLFRELIATLHDLGGDDAPAGLQIRVNYADGLVRAKRYDEAEPLLLRAWDPLVRAFGKDGLFVRKAARGLAAIYDAKGRADEAALWRAQLPADGADSPK